MIWESQDVGGGGKITVDISLAPAFLSFALIEPDVLLPSPE
jgi:hypothetical protein